MNDLNMEDIEKVVVYLLNNDGIFYASLLSQMRRIADPKFPFAAGVTIKGGYIELYWNPEKFKEMKNMKEKAAVLEHECQHLVKNHLTRKQNKDYKNWAMATDLSINQHIKNLPDWTLSIDRYPEEFKMYRDKPAEYYYNQLKKNEKYMEISSCECTDGKPGGDGKGNNKSKGNEKGNEKKDKQKGDGNGEDEQENDEQGSGKKSHQKVTVKNSDGSVHDEFDLDDMCDQSKWSDKNGDSDSPEVKEEVIKQSIQKAVDYVERLKGKLPAGLEDDIEAWKKPALIPWQRVLRQWVGTKVRARFKYSLKRPNRRYGAPQKGKIPTRKLQIAVAIDTSGSISDADLQAFIHEITGIMSSYKSTVTIIECDAAVQNVYKLTPFTKVKTKFKGRGGTDFRPVFEYIDEKHLDIDLLIFFTDLCGSFPDKKPRYPTLWVTVDGTYKAPWGDTLELKRPDQNQNDY